MYMVQSKPEFSLEVPKSSDIVSPVPLEILRSISSSLEDSPPSILHITVDVKWFSTSRVNSVDSILSTTSLIGLSTMLIYSVLMDLCKYIQYILCRIV